MKKRKCKQSLPKFKDLTRKEKIVLYNKLVKIWGKEECWICGRKRKTRRLHLDHSHKTGKVRGVLCMACNRGLRWFNDCPITLNNAAWYCNEDGFNLEEI